MGLQDQWKAVGGVVLAVAACMPALGQAPPNYDFDFVTIGAVGNAPWAGQDPLGTVYGRGGVNYEYRIGRTEVSTSQWMEFINTFSTQPGMMGSGGPAMFWGPSSWGASPDPGYSGPGRRYRLTASIPDAERVPVFGISWRDAAIFTNWLHHDKPPDWSLIQTGAYDASTFTTNPNGTINDQRTHSPGAKYWIPTLDEWLKAAHYDANRYGPGEDGWWYYSHSSDMAPVPGLPGVGETSATLNLPSFGELYIPLGAYSHVQSPWGLFDTSGGAMEWMEDTFVDAYKMFNGTSAGLTALERDSIIITGAAWPQTTGPLGLRIASAVPAPSTSAGVISITWIAFRRRRIK